MQVIKYLGAAKNPEKKYIELQLKTGDQLENKVLIFRHFFLTSKLESYGEHSFGGVWRWRWEQQTPGKLYSSNFMRRQSAQHFKLAARAWEGGLPQSFDKLR